MLLTGRVPRLLLLTMRDCLYVYILMMRVLVLFFFFLVYAQGFCTLYSTCCNNFDILPILLRVIYSTYNGVGCVTHQYIMLVFMTLHVMSWAAGTKFNL